MDSHSGAGWRGMRMRAPKRFLNTLLRICFEIEWFLLAAGFVKRRLIYSLSTWVIRSYNLNKENGYFFLKEVSGRVW